MPVCDICCQDVASVEEMKTHLLLSHLENKMRCPFCSLAGVSFDELSFHMNTAHEETPSMASQEASATHLGPPYTGNGRQLRTVTRKEGLGAESLPPEAPFIQTLVPVKQSSTDAAVGSVCGANSSTHSPESHTHTKNAKERQKSVEVHVASKQKRLSSPLKEKLFPCPMCSLVCQDCFILQEHVELHLQEQSISEGAKPDGEASACSTNISGVKHHECPLCSLCFSDAFSLQEHVELHLENGAATGAESSMSDLTLARQLQEEEEEQRRRREAKREAEEFKKLQKQFGMDGSGGYLKQIERNMERAVSRGNMVPAEFHMKRAELMERLATGVDDGETRTAGVMGALYDYFQREPRDTAHVWLSADTDHYSSSEGDKGWGCGYRNFQMLLSSVCKQEPYKNILYDTPIPNIPRVQALIEEAWKQGVDPVGASHFNQRLRGTRAWVGTTEIYSLLTSLSVNARVVDFHKPTGPGGTHTRLLDWVKQYFSQPATQNGRLPPRVVRTSLPPIYLQHQGHSRSVVGVEQKRNGSLCLLLFDPGCPPSEMVRLLDRDPSAVAAAVRRMRKFPKQLKQQQFQVLVVEGLLTPEQKQWKIANSRTLQAERIP